jgi:LacI family fructose operon transcriptional repressor
MASIKDVAQKAGVSTATVSRMMAGKSYISEETRERVQAAINALDYRPNRVAQRLRERQSRILALIVSDIQNPFFGALSRTVETFAQRHGLSVFICNTDEDAAKEAHYLELMLQEKVAGVILSPTRRALPPLKTLKQKGIPVVTVDRRVSRDFDSVLIDNTEAARQLTGRVIAAGYTRVAGIFGANSFTADERRAGFGEELAAHGLKPHAEELPPAFEAEGRAAMERLLALSPRPDAVICSSALLATGAYQALNAARLTNEVGFACFDDPPWATCVSPAVTVIAQPTALIGETAFELLLKRIEEPDRATSHIRLQGMLIERDSLRGNGQCAT